MKFILLIGTGGFIGSVTRYLISKYIQDLSVFPSFPLGTFIVNILGCLFIGLLFGTAEKGTWMSPEIRMFLTVGFCGGFTTFSTFSNEAIALLRDGEILYFLSYIGLSVLLGLVAVYMGYLITKLI